MPFQKKKVIPINYTSRDFDSIKQELLDHAKRYYPDTFQDFSDASFGSMMLDTVSYIGDVLSFYLDYQVNESFLDTAIEYNNIVKLARQMGHKYTARASSSGIATFYVIAPSATSGYGPDPAYLPRLKKGTKLATNAGVPFTLNEDVDFANVDNEIVVASANSTTGMPTGYAVKAFGQVISGELAAQSTEIGSYQKFRRVRIDGTNITEVVSVFDSSGYEYFEVDHLSQNVVYKPVVNRSDDSKHAPFIMKPFAAPRRFIVENDGDSTYLQFGFGSEENLNTEKVLDPSKVILRQHARDYVTDKSFDPSNLIETDKLGVTPSNTTLTIVFRTNGAANVNISSKALRRAVDPVFRFESPADLVTSKVSDVVSSLEVENEKPIVGDVSVPSSQELKYRAYGTYTSQNRAVTKQDYVSLVYNMHPKFGAIKRVNVVRDADSLKRNINMYVISESATGRFISTPATIKTNLKTWLSNHKMINDTIDILDAKVVNFGLNFTIVADMEANKHKIMERSARALRTRLTRVKMDISEPFRITDAYSVLKNVEGVLDVVSVDVVKKVGGLYSDMNYDFENNTTPDGRLLLAPENVVLEVKFPETDIRGVVK